MSNVGFGRLCTNIDMNVQEYKAFSFFTDRMLQMSSVQHVHIKITLLGTGLDVWFSQGDLSSQLNGLVNMDGVRCMLEGKGYQRADIVLPINCAFVNKAIKYKEVRAEKSERTLTCFVKCTGDIGVVEN